MMGRQLSFFDGIFSTRSCPTQLHSAASRWQLHRWLWICPGPWFLWKRPTWSRRKKTEGAWMAWCLMKLYERVHMRTYKQTRQAFFSMMDERLGGTWAAPNSCQQLATACTTPPVKRERLQQAAKPSAGSTLHPQRQNHTTVGEKNKQTNKQTAPKANMHPI